MSQNVRTETETVIKRILPYLKRRGYDAAVDIDFETPVKLKDRYSKGYADLIITKKNTPQFVIEAKRNRKQLTQSDMKQALSYGKSLKVPFVVVTNGREIRIYNCKTGQPMLWGNRLADKVPTKEQLTKVMSIMRKTPELAQLSVNSDESLPFRQALPLVQLNALFARCHNIIRNIEKNEETAFADFSKLLFLKLLEEKHDTEEEFNLTYSYRFWSLAERPTNEADQVRTAVKEMLRSVREMGYGDVIPDDLYIKNPKTYQAIVKELASVSLTDSDYDVKGTAFEYFVRATLKGKKLGQYFTPRPVVQLMAALVKSDAIVASLASGTPVKVADPACGTGGFLVYLLKQAMNQVDQMNLTNDAKKRIKSQLSQDVFHGCDANDGVASSAKMNMIIAGDGHNNILCENSLAAGATLWPATGEELIVKPEFDFILANPPFGTAEEDSLSSRDKMVYPVAVSKGQNYFLQRMILAAKPYGKICTVIDNGLLNNDSGSELRKWAMQNAKLLAVVQLPDETFKPNKINVKSSILYFEKLENEDLDSDQEYPVTFINLESLGYHGSGELIRGFDFEAYLQDVTQHAFNGDIESINEGDHWRSFKVSNKKIAADPNTRWDLKYWLPEVEIKTQELLDHGAKTLEELNTIETKRGKSLSASTYVGPEDGYAVVIKAGSCITKQGEITISSADWIEKNTFDDLPELSKLQKGDVLIASTGVGTLGKAAVWENNETAVADNHITVIRPDPLVVDPYYLCDFLRVGFGKAQIARLYTGSTGLIELTPQHVNRVVVSLLEDIKAQRAFSRNLRKAERTYRTKYNKALDLLRAQENQFLNETANYKPFEPTNDMFIDQAIIEI